MKLIVSLIFIILNVYINLYSQMNYTIVRSTTKKTFSVKENRKDTIIVSNERIIEIDGFYLFEDTLYFHNYLVRTYLPIKNTKQIEYFEGSKICDIMILSEPFNILSIDKNPPIFSFIELGDRNSIISFYDEASVVNSLKNDVYYEEFGEKLIEGKTIYFKKKIFLNHNLQVVYINCSKDMLGICDFIIDNINIEDSYPQIHK